MGTTWVMCEGRLVQSTQPQGPTEGGREGGRELLGSQRRRKGAEGTRGTVRREGGRFQGTMEGEKAVR